MTRLRPTDAARRQTEGLGPDHSEALARGLQIMATFGAEHPSQSLSDVARRIDLPRATVRRALLTMEALGYLSQDGRQFRLTPRVLHLARAYLTANGVSVLLQPVCDRIATFAQHSCTAAVLENDEVVMIARALPTQRVPVGAGIGYRIPAYCSALGRVLLAALPPDALDAFLARTDLRPVTPLTLTDPHAIKARIDDARRDGFCVVDGEAEAGFCSIAVPLRRFDGTVVAALNLGAAATAADLVAQMLPLLQAEAAALSGTLA